MGKLAPARVSYRDDFVISYHIYVRPGTKVAPVSCKHPLIIWLSLERARWPKSRAVIGYPSRAIFPAQDYPLHSASKFPRKSYNKSLIDHVCSVKMAGYSLVLFCEFMDLYFVSVHKHTKKTLANIQPSWPQAWSITHIYCIPANFFWVKCARFSSLQNVNFWRFTDSFQKSPKISWQLLKIAEGVERFLTTSKQG